MVVVGAGPAGLALALLLARGGVAVTLVEARAQSSRLLRGDGLMPSGLEALDRMGLTPLLERLPQRPLEAWSFWVQGRPLFTAAEPMGSPVPCSLVDTGALLEALLEQAQQEPSFQLVRGSATSLLGLEEGGVRGVELEGGRRLPAELVVACDGRGSRLRRQAQLERRQEEAPLSVLWFSLEGPAAEPLQRWLGGRFVTLVGDGGSCALFRSARGALRVGWLQPTAGAGAGEPEDCEPDSSLPWPERLARLSPPALAALWRQLDPAHLPPPQALTLEPALAPRWWRPGLLLLGDAAHPMSPIRAQGLNMALRDALVAAERLLPLLAPGKPRQEANAPGADHPPPGADRLDRVLEEISQLRRAEVQAVQALQRQERARAETLRQRPWLRRLVAASAPWSGPLLARRWQAGQPTLRQGLPLP